MRIRAIGLAAATLLLGSTTLAAGTPEQKCEAAKNQEAGKLAFCLQKAEKKLLLSADMAKYDESVAKCKTKFAEKWAKEEQKAAGSGTACPTTGDRAALQTIITERAADVQGALEDGLACPFKSGDCETDSITRFLDNNDGTVTDLYSGLTWEVKNDLGGLNDKDNTYSWTSVSFAADPDGTVFTTFLAQMNDTVGGGANCFAGQCDWRLPTIHELKFLLFRPESNGTCSSNPCVDPSLPGNTESSFYWSATTYSSFLVWAVEFSDGSVANGFKHATLPVRAVRGR